MKRSALTSGFAAMPMVTALALVMVAGVVMIFRATMMNRDQAAQAQLGNDYSQREDAFLRAMVAVFPRKAIASMKGGYVASNDYSWAKIFEESVALAMASQRLTPELMAALELTNQRTGDVGDTNQATVGTWVTSLTGVAGQVTPGTTAYAEIFNQPGYAGRLPPLLQATAAMQLADAERPVVSPLKTYSAQSAELGADVGAYPTYNLIPYPNIRFGYAVPGQPFVSKRNWWAFTVSYGDSSRTVAKSYVLSLYEVPSQMPIEASTFAAIGRHEDGTAWNAAAIEIDGSVYGEHLSVEGTFGASRMAGRSAIDLPEAIEIGGVQVDENFDALGVRERLQVEQRSEMLPVALSANSGRMTFLPIHSGTGFLQKPATGTTLSDWDTYIIGAANCDVTVEAMAMVSLEDQTPTKLRIRYKTAAGSQAETYLQRDVNWPKAMQAGGETIPFQSELTNNGRSCLTFYPSLLNAWLQGMGGASVSINRRIHFSIDPNGDVLTVLPPTQPPAPEAMCVIIRKGKDLTSYTAGLSMVAPLRVYVGDDLNIIPAASAPAGSGWPAGVDFYPPMSIFAAELRVGTTAFNRPIMHYGQLSTLVTGDATAWKPLDLKSGSDDAVHSDTISAELAPLRSPAELPPIHQMNWLVVIEEIPRE